MIWVFLLFAGKLLHLWGRYLPPQSADIIEEETRDINYGADMEKLVFEIKKVL